MGPKRLLYCVLVLWKCLNYGSIFIMEMSINGYWNPLLFIVLCLQFIAKLRIPQNESIIHHPVTLCNYTSKRTCKCKVSKYYLAAQELQRNMFIYFGSLFVTWVGTEDKMVR